MNLVLPGLTGGDGWLAEEARRGLDCAGGSGGFQNFLAKLKQLREALPESLRSDSCCWIDVSDSVLLGPLFLQQHILQASRRILSAAQPVLIISGVPKPGRRGAAEARAAIEATLAGRFSRSARVAVLWVQG